MTNRHWLIVVIRALSPFSMFWNPFLGLMIADRLDAHDVMLWDLVKAPRLTNKLYQITDKLLDDLILVVGVIVALYYEIVPSSYLPLFLFLAIWRLVGSTIVYLSKQRKLFVIFPNFILWYMYMFFFIYVTDTYSLLNYEAGFALTATALFGFNLIQELVLHYLQIHPWTMMKSKGKTVKQKLFLTAVTFFIALGVALPLGLIVLNEIIDL